MKANIASFIKNYLGGLIYLLAGTYMMLTKPPEFITVTAIVLCIALAFLSTTKHKDWAVIGGGMMIAGSLFLQSVLQYRCIDCMRTDMMIFAGMVVINLTGQDRHKFVLKVMTVAVAIFLVGNIAFHYNPKTLLGFGSVEVIAATQEDDCTVDFEGNSLEVVTADKKTITLNVGNKPIVLYSPSCGACVKAIEALAKADPLGDNWIAVLAYGDTIKANKLLDDSGYKGERYVIAKEWSGTVPTLITKDGEGNIVNIGGEQQMIKTVRGDAY